MKRALYFIAITIALIKAILSSTDVNTILDAMADKPKKDVFKVFHYLHKKEYKLESEEGLKRYRIFKENLNWIKAKNAELGKEVYGITKFMDLTHEEFKNTYLIKIDKMQSQIASMKSNSNSFLGNSDNKFINFDLMADSDEDEGAVIKTQNTENTSSRQNATPINWIPFLNKPKDQRSCGSCWAFAAVATLEGQYNSKFGKLYDFSEQYLVDCDTLDGGCNGGWPSNTYSWLSKNGVVEQKSSPYTGKKGVCESAKLSAVEFKIVKDYTMYEKSSADKSVWLSLLSKGPILVAMDASDPGLGMYRPAGNEAWTPAACGGLNHAVVAVGYEVVNGVEYLIVRNSWGEDWGIGGNFRVRADKSCGLLDYAWLPEVVNGTSPNPSPNPGPNPGPNPEPNPGPEPVDPDYIPENCVRVYENCGYQGKFNVACDSNSTFSGKVSGVKVSANLNNVDEVFLFKNPQCVGTPVRVGYGLDCLNENGKKYLAKSMAFNKRNAPGCIYFYSTTCYAGNPQFEVCGNVRDVQLGRFNNIKSIDLGESYEFATFYEQPDFVGRAFSINLRQHIFNINNNRELMAALKNTRSVYFGPLPYEA